MKRYSRKLISLSIVGLLLSQGTSALAATSDQLYLNAYTLTMSAVTSGTQKSINQARVAIDALKGTDASWAIGQLSSNVDMVQQPILVKIINAINTAKENPTQANVNIAKATIDADLLDVWKYSYSSAVDEIEKGVINSAIDAYNKASTTKSVDDIKLAVLKINDIKTSTDSTVTNWANSFAVQVKALAVANNVHSGDRTDPIGITQNQKISLQNYSSDTPKNIELQLQEIYVGDEANSIIASENWSNQKPSSDEEWVLMKINLKYASGSEDSLDATDVLWDNFYTSEGAKISIIDRAALSNNRKSIYDVDLYPGAESSFWYAVLVKKSDWTNPLIRIGTGYDSKKYETIYTWYSIR